VRLQEVNLHNYTRRGSSDGREEEQVVKNKRNAKSGSINGYPVPRERHVITEQMNREGECESHVWYQGETKRREIAHADEFRN